MWIGAILSGPNAFDGFDDLMAVRTWLTVREIWVVRRLWSCLIIRRLFLSLVKLVGLVKYLLNEFAMSLLEVMVWLLNLIERLGSEEVGSLLFNDLMVFQ